MEIFDRSRVLVALTLPCSHPGTSLQLNGPAVIFGNSPVSSMEFDTPVDDQGAVVEREEDVSRGTVNLPAPLRGHIPVSINPPLGPPTSSGNVTLTFTDAQFDRWIASQAYSQTSDRPFHALSPSEPNEDEYYGDTEGQEALEDAPALTDSGSANIGNNPGRDFVALLASSDNNNNSQPVDNVAGDDVLLDQLGLAWAACYAQEETAGPDIDQGLADLVAKYVRAKPVDDNIRASMAKISVPGNCPKLVVPSLNSDVQVALSKLNAKLTERVLAKITGIVCKSMVPVLNVLSEVMKKNVRLPSNHVLALSEAMALLSTVICIANQGRKNNIQNTIDEPLLRQICGPDTAVGEKELFGFNVLEKVTELKKAQKLGLDGKTRGFGPMRGRRRFPSRPYYKTRSRGGSRGGGQYYAAYGGRGSRPFLHRGQRGRGQRGQ